MESWANRVVQSGIPLWDVSRPLPDTLIARVRRSDFPRLRRLRGRRLRYRVLGRFGLPVPVGKLWRRRGLALGAALFFLAFYLAASLVWFVDVEAPPGLDKEAIRAAAARAGLRPGQRLDRIDPVAVERRLHLDVPRVAWAHLQLRGTRALLQVAERPGWREDDRVYGDLVADRDGLVIQVVPLRGEPLVAAGDTVAQGQVLIRGSASAEDPDDGGHVPGAEAGPSPSVRAEGRVYARVWYEEYGEAPLVQREQRPTGRRERYHVVTAGPFRWSFGPVRSRFEHYVERRELRWGAERDGRPVFHWETVWRDEMELRRRERDVHEALREALELARRRIDIRRKADSRVEREEVEVLSRGEGDGRVRVRVLVEARENIAAFQPVFHHTERVSPEPSQRVGPEGAFTGT